MVTGETKSIGAKRELFHLIKGRYHRAGKAEKGKILDEYSANAGLNGKYATRLLNEGYKRGKKKPGPRPKYSNDQEFLTILRVFWRTLNYPCGKLLKPTIRRISKAVHVKPRNYQRCSKREASNGKFLNNR